MTKEQFDSFQEAVIAASRATSQVPESVDLAKEKIANFAQTMGITNERAAQMVVAFIAAKEATEKTGREIARVPISPLEEAFRRTRTAIRGFTASVGTAGFVFMRVGYQAYWAAIGLIFYSLSVRRARFEQIRMQRTALSMIQAYYRIKEAEEDLKETIEKYGPASREARRAARELALMRIRQRIAEEQLRSSIEQAVVAEMSAFLTLFPIYINFIALIWNIRGALGALNALRAMSVAVNYQEASAKTVNAVASEISKNAEMAERIAHVANTGAVVTETVATWGAVTAKTALIGVATMGIGALIAWGATMALQAHIQREVNRRMAEMRRQMRSMKTEVERLSDSYLSMSGTTKEVITSTDQLSKVMEELEEKMTGRSVYDSVLAVNSALNILSRSLREVRDIRLQYSISIEGIQEARTQIESLEQVPERRTNIEVTQEIRQVFIPAVFPRITEQIQYIRQIVIPARISNVQDLTQYIKQEVQLADIPEVEDKVQRIRQIAILARIPEIEDKIQYIRQELIPVSIPRIEDQRQRIFQEIEVQTRIPQLVRRNVEVEIDVPSRIVKKVDLDIETRIGGEFRRTVERPSGNVINLSIGQIQVRNTEEMRDIIRNVYYSLQRNVREIPYA